MYINWINDAKRPETREKRLKVARVFSTNPKVRTTGNKSFLNDVIKLAGGINIFEDIETFGERIY